MPETSSDITIAEILQRDDPAEYSAAQQAAEQVERLITDQPGLAGWVLQEADVVLQSPDRRTPQFSGEKWQGPQTEIVLAIVALLRHTHHGRYLMFADEIADRQFDDSSHRELVGIIQGLDRRQGTNLETARRAVALSGLRIYAGLQAERHSGAA